MTSTTTFIAATPMRPASQHALMSHATMLSPRRRPTRTTAPPPPPQARPARTQQPTMMAKVSKFGPFTPAVIIARLILGDKPLNKLRGKAISLHSQVITAFCDFTGAGPKMRQALIREAKNNGNTLGFLS